jgi:hypothetical protein
MDAQLVASCNNLSAATVSLQNLYTKFHGCCASRELRKLWAFPKADDPNQSDNAGDPSECPQAHHLFMVLFIEPVMIEITLSCEL